VLLELLDGTSFEAKIHRRSPVVDPLTGTVKLTVRTSELPPGAVPGAFTRAKVLLESRVGAPSLPRSAVTEIDGKPHVYVIEEGKALRIPIETGLEGDERVEVTSGLEPDRQVVADARGMTDGMALKPVGEGGAEEAPAGEGRRRGKQRP
jgi:membrane fusion protein (multidrug efflux system)